jgi:hypothetical protein
MPPAQQPVDATELVDVIPSDTEVSISDLPAVAKSNDPIPTESIQPSPANPPTPEDVQAKFVEEKRGIGESPGMAQR